MRRILAQLIGQHLQEEVRIEGHVQSIRKLGNLAFLLVRDRSGTVQVVVELPELLAVAEKLSCETPVAITGKVVAHPGKSAGAELHALSIEPLAPPAASLPLELGKNKKIDALSLSALLDYRPLTLRNEKVKAIFKIEAVLCAAFREYLGNEGFTEIHSPKIVATGTEGGAQLFAVNYFGQTAYLAQSPQFYKQIMVGSLERVFEIGPVYRAEEHDTARHLNEYISMDIEMGFIKNEDELMDLETQLLAHMFARVNAECQEELALYNAQIPQFTEIPRVSLQQACELLRTKCGWDGKQKRQNIESPVEQGMDLDPEGERLLCQYFQSTAGSELVFVTHYPWEMRPFYAMPLAESSLSRSFDLLYRGLEITTGGQRIHLYEQLQESIKSRGLQLEPFTDYLQCFKYGMPPHGGLAIGLERLAKQLLGLGNVKQASLFPRDRNRVSP